MKQLKTLCFLATAITLTLAPISTSQTPTQTVYASETHQNLCTSTGNGWIKCPKEHGGWTWHFDENYKSNQQSFWGGLFGFIFSLWSAIEKLF
ncbi:hypothetical protein [Streptococcus equi]|uniref:hypothetical protein n=1 Tax=Streptococcus equi TaxID=1336 RepID=UPI0005BB3E55|nr:hypothetical protein [Streptococcus equi]VTP90659.1 membrane protein [Streptococcus equi subsp. zooepidemicus]KIS20461.1 membrane protein [Streptococcus equi subsp. zooepidemicus SzAM35]HEK9995961.1 hypothetical protein [Streptococcus equi subsp. zooepidemicus]HEL0553277.1 hypothetical protein [Streptococcus equi subsp. zooepidemicus]HEL0583056.1 hypothetical protein [Streptococcus equi subsp. zooepidemicus]